MATFQGHTGAVYSAVFSPDGRKLLATFEGHTDYVSSAVFSPDGRRVLTASGDNTAQLWSVLPADVPPPDWCGDFLVWLGGKRIAPDGQIETLSGDELLKLGARLRPRQKRRFRLRPPVALAAFAAARAAPRSLRYNHAGAGG